LARNRLRFTGCDIIVVECKISSTICALRPKLPVYSYGDKEEVCSSEISMKQERDKLGLRQIACNRFPRFIIHNQFEYWDGHGWTKQRRQARLYAHLDAIAEDIATIKSQHKWRQ
jgi:hypothetical protein